jgi:Nucleotidyl transferase AbiEii toxin, Type IV TA system
MPISVMTFESFWCRRSISRVTNLLASRLRAILFGMKIEATSQDAARHRLLEGILLRLARRPDPGEFVLRGGMLMRHWFRPIARPAEDLDLVATFPFAIDDAAARFLPVLADGAVADGVIFDIDRVRVEGIWLSTGSPGVRVFASGVAGGAEVEFNVDITFGPPPRPAAEYGELPTGLGEAARVWMCRPEAVVGHKMQALWHRGMLGWRPKDLDDLRLLLAQVPMDDAELRGAIAAYLADVGGTGADARAIFGPASWWGMKLSSARWLDFVKSSPGRDAPRGLAGVVAELACRLAPILEGLP